MDSRDCTKEEMIAAMEGTRKFLTVTLALNDQDAIVGFAQLDMEMLEKLNDSKLARNCRMAGVTMARSVPQLLEAVEAMAQITEMMEEAEQAVEAQRGDNTPKETDSDDSSSKTSNDSETFAHGLLKQHGRTVH